MRRIRLAAAVATVALLGTVTASVLAPSGAGAAISKTSGAVSVAALPASVKAGASTSKTSIRAFVEASPVTLATGLTVDAPTVGIQYSRRAQLPSRQLANGTVVASHLLHGDVGSGSKTFQGKAVFDRRIAGLLTSDSQLDATDKSLGRSSTQYPTGTARRGVEFADHPSTPNTDEWIRFVDAFTLEVRLQVSTLDQLRVLTYLNRPPVAANDSYAVAEDTTLSVSAPGILANDSDPDGSTLTASIASAPSHGTVALASNGSFQYIPANDYFGSDSFAYTASDGQASGTATVTITVQPRNDATVTGADAYTTVADEVHVPAPGVLGNDNDPDGALTASLEASPITGTVSLAGNGSFSYQAGPTFNGSDSFTYRATDPWGGFGVGQVTITGAPVITPPVAYDDSASVTEGEPLVVAAPGVLGNDVQGNRGPIMATLVEAPATGTVVLAADGSYRYNPKPGFVGTDTFTYRASDSASSSNIATVTVTVRAMSLSFSQSALEGGSIVNVVAFDPRLDGTVLAGSDVAGIYRSTDWGVTWQAANTGGQGISTAALQFSPTVSGKAYAASGDGANGTFAVSVDDGVTWEVRSAALHFDGGNGRPGRVTGNLLAFDDARGLIYAATWNQGVMRSADDGRTWKAIGLTGADLRSLVIDPENPEVVYATTYPNSTHAGVYKTTNASASSPSFAALGASPRDVEEIVLIGRTLYAASGFDGVTSSTDGGATWQVLGSGPTLGSGIARSNGPVWVSIDGYETAAGTMLYAGAVNPAVNGAGYDTVMRSNDGGRTWTSLTNDPAAIHNEVGGPTGHQWWWDGNSRLGRFNSWANHIEVAAGAPGRIMISGRIDIWSSSDDGANWYPMVEGLGVTVTRGAMADPNQPSRVYATMTDWVLTYSDDGLRDDIHRSMPTGSSQAWAMALDTSTTPSRVYLGTGDIASNTKGELYSNPNPATSSWVSEGLAALTGAKRVIGVSANVVAGENIVLAAVEQGGIWRKSGGQWTQVSSGAMAGAETSGPAARFAWLPGSPAAFLYDRNTGIWRSSDAGRTWAQIWVKPSKQNNTGYLALDPTDPTALYVSVGWDGVYRLAGATTGAVGAGITPVKVGNFTVPGPVAFDRYGRLYVAAILFDQPNRLAMSTDDGATWRELGEAVWGATAMRPWSIDVAPDGTLYVAMRGMGVLIGDRH